MITTMKVPAALRDRIARIAAVDYAGATLAGALEKLVEEHEAQAALAAYARLRNDPEQWSDYEDELAGIERAGAADWLRGDR
jgi:hypothetical protein